MSDLKDVKQKAKKLQQKRRKRNKSKSKLRHDQASDSVVWSIVRRHNSARRGYCNFNRFPNFTPQSRNLLQIDSFRTSAYRQNSLGLAQRKPKKGEKHQFVLVMNKQGRKHQPKKCLGQCRVAIGGKKKIAKQIDAQTRYRFYRPELSKLAQKRMWRVMQNRAEYKRNERRRSKVAKKVEKFAGAEEENANAGADGDMQIVD